MIASTYSGRLASLIQRERQTRYSGGVIGHFWAYLTPIAWIAFVVVLFHALSRTPPIYVPPEIFVATGILPYLAFRQTVTSLSRAGPANRSLLYIKPIKMHDLLVASAVQEALNLIVTATIIFCCIGMLFDSAPPSDIGGVILGLSLALFLAVGVGRFIAVIGLFSDSFARSVPILLRPVFWLSGIFYTATELPSAVQNAMWYSPLLHITEITRESYFLGYRSPVADVWYPILIAALFYAISSPIENYIMRNRLGRYRL